MRPVIEKQKFSIRHIFYILIFIICIVAVGVAIYMQFYRDAKLDVIFGLKKEDPNEAEFNTLKEEFLSSFDNNIHIIENYTTNVKKIIEDDIIFQGYKLEETTDYYTIDVKIPYFNIDSEIPRIFNQEIINTFKDKAESIKSSTKRYENRLTYNVRYKTYIYKDVLSLIIISELKEGENSQRIILQAYNYDLKEEKEITIGELLTIKNLSVRDVNNTIKQEVNKVQEQNIRLKEAGYDVKVRDTNSSEYKVENAEQFFIGEKGYLFIVYPYGNKEYTSQMDIVIFK